MVVAVSVCRACRPSRARDQRPEAHANTMSGGTQNQSMKVNARTIGLVDAIGQLVAIQTVRTSPQPSGASEPGTVTSPTNCRSPERLDSALRHGRDGAPRRLPFGGFGTGPTDRFGAASSVPRMSVQGRQYQFA